MFTVAECGLQEEIKLDGNSGQTLVTGFCNTAISVILFSFFDSWRFHSRKASALAKKKCLTSLGRKGYGLRNP